MQHKGIQWNRAVVKVGSALIAPGGNGCSNRYLLALADFIQHSLQQGKEVVLVSSGSVAAGRGVYRTDPEKALTIPEKQAMAAIGQIEVMRHWQKLFDNRCAQLLLTRSDLQSEKRRFNARNALATLLEMSAIPVVNENDSVVVDELVVGDNDNLAAQVAHLCKADLLIICSDVDGLYDRDPRSFKNANLIPRVTRFADEMFRGAGASSNPLARGGMRTKVEAAEYASQFGINTLITNGKKAESFELLKRHSAKGTLFEATVSDKQVLAAE